MVLRHTVGAYGEDVGCRDACADNDWAVVVEEVELRILGAD